MNNKLIHDLNTEFAILSSEAMVLADDDENNVNYQSLIISLSKIKESIKANQLDALTNELKTISNSLRELNKEEKDAESFTYAMESFDQIKKLIEEHAP